MAIGSVDLAGTSAVSRYCRAYREGDAGSVFRSAPVRCGPSGRHGGSPRYAACVDSGPLVARSSGASEALSPRVDLRIVMPGAGSRPASGVPTGLGRRTLVVPTLLDPRLTVPTRPQAIRPFRWDREWSLTRMVGRKDRPRPGWLPVRSTPERCPRSLGLTGQWSPRPTRPERAVVRRGGAPTGRSTGRLDRYRCGQGVGAGVRERSAVRRVGHQDDPAHRYDR
ncbi:hypothetical protein FHR38_005804 [Micromonospora polyrhachis]|uniref:Uncharacterized protein n=1 Tax=Micromonospora polyrhachis TaxID=1282883 RepID=A0A7W7WSB2_9ACTN|nr:hypothetical protein [Micromonospora polyrhachis]